MANLSTTITRKRLLLARSSLSEDKDKYNLTCLKPECLKNAFGIFGQSIESTVYNNTFLSKECWQNCFSYGNTP